MNIDGLIAKYWLPYCFDQSAKVELKDHRYDLEKLEQLDTGEWMLHVSMIDILTAEKLHKRNVVFNE
jgi:hypothetical protein